MESILLRYVFVVLQATQLFECKVKLKLSMIRVMQHQSQAKIHQSLQHQNPATSVPAASEPCNIRPLPDVSLAQNTKKCAHALIPNARGMLVADHMLEKSSAHVLLS
jgi:hypothetical protein